MADIFTGLHLSIICLLTFLSIRSPRLVVSRLVIRLRKFSRDTDPKTSKQQSCIRDTHARIPLITNEKSYLLLSGVGDSIPLALLFLTEVFRVLGAHGCQACLHSSSGFLSQLKGCAGARFSHIKPMMALFFFLLTWGGQDVKSVS